MVKLIKVISGLLGALLILAIITLASLSHMINPDTIKKQAQTWAHEHLNRTLNIAGDVDWHAFPSPAIQIRDVELSNPKTFDQQPMARAKQIRISLALAPLLHQKISLRHLDIDGLNLNLTKKPSGLSNWALPDHATHPVDKPTHFSININRVSLKHSTIRIVNLRKQQTLHFNNVSLKSSSLIPNQPFTLKGQATLSSPSISFEPTLSINGKIQFDSTHNTLSIQDFELICQTPQQMLSPITLHTAGTINLKEQTLHLKPYQLELAKEITLSGYFNAHQLFEAPHFSGRLDTNTFNPKTVLSNMNIPLKTKQKQALSSLKISADFQATTKQASLTNLSVLLDKQPISGKLNYLFQPHTLNTHLHGNTINLDFYTPETKQRKKIKLTQDILSHNTSPTKTLQASGQISFKHVTANNLAFQNVQAQFNYTKHRLTIDKFSAAVLDGSLRGSAKLHFNKLVTVFSVTQTLANANLAKLLRHHLKTAPITGRVTLKAQLNGITSTLPNSLKGRMSINAQNGVLYGVDIEHQLARVVSHLSKQPLTKSDQQRSAFRSFQTELSINQGIINNSNLEINLPRHRIKGQGTINTHNRAINQNLEIKALYPLDINTPIGSTDLSLYDIPLRITGTIDDPKPMLDFSKIIAITVKKQAEQVIKKTLENQVTDKLHNLIKDKLPF